MSQWFHQSLCSCFQNHVLFAGSAGKLRKNGLCGTVASQVADLACAASEDEADFNHRIVLSDKFRNLRFRDTMNPVVPETFLFKGGCGGSAVFLCRS